MEVIDTYFKSVNKSLLFLFIFIFSTSSFSQEVYFRVSENDCFNCYVNINQHIIGKSDIQFLFPESSKGKRFDEFNKRFFKNQIIKEKVIFSDSLYALTNQPLDDLSGLVFIYNGNVIFSEKGAYIDEEKLKRFNSSVLSFTMTLNIREKGFSNRNLIKADYNDDHLLITDFLFKKLYLIDGVENTEINFDAIDFLDIAKKSLKNVEYLDLEKNIDLMSRYGKNGIELVNVTYSEGKFYISLYCPFISDDEIIDENGNKKEVFRIGNKPNYLVLKKEEFNERNVLKNIFSFDFENEQYFYALDELVQGNSLLKLNQVIYSDEQFNKDQSYPLFTKFHIDAANKRITFDKYLDSMDLLDFQKYKNFNTLEFINVISFISQDQTIVLKDFPYVIEPLLGTKKKLEWDENVNKVSYPQDIKYKNLQFWKSNNGYSLLFQKEDEIVVKEYTNTWELKSQKPFMFNKAFIKQLYITKKYIYMKSTTEDIYRIDNYLI
ncbi:hypothetical protein [Myroides sp. TSA_177.3]|uniref:hypothetical protein n=1 Tax=Myroides sp. TSA_177.3 TaxID=3415650 RepID=UPI0040457205